MAGCRCNRTSHTLLAMLNTRTATTFENFGWWVFWSPGVVGGGAGVVGVCPFVFLFVCLAVCRSVRHIQTDCNHNQWLGLASQCRFSPSLSLLAYVFCMHMDNPTDWQCTHAQGFATSSVFACIPHAWVAIVSPSLP